MKKLLWIGLLITAVRILYLFVNHRDLDIEEAQYWTWSQHLAWGYHSKPPMISWIIFFCTSVFGNSEWALRILCPVIYFITALFLYGCGKKLFNPAIGFWSALTVLLLPGVTYSATIISTDVFLILFWSAALYFFIQGCKTHQFRWWLGCGLAIGFGLLSKYTMLAFFLSGLLYFICTLHTPSPLKKFGPYGAVIIAFLVFLPNAIWNTHHHNATFHHLVQHNIDIEGLHFHLKNLAVFLLCQVAILGPIIAGFLLIAFFKGRFIDKDSFRLLVCFTLPILIVMCIEALLSRAYANWAAVAYPSGIILTVAYMWEQNFRKWLKINAWLHVLIALLLYGWELSVAYGYCSWPRPNRPDWQDFGVALTKAHNQYPHAYYLVSDRELWSKSIYYGKISKADLYIWDPNHTVDWVDNPVNLTIPAGQSFILISNSDTLPGDMVNSVKQYRKLGQIFVTERLLGRYDRIYFYWVQGL